MNHQKFVRCVSGNNRVYEITSKSKHENRISFIEIKIRNSFGILFFSWTLSCGARVGMTHGHDEFCYASLEPDWLKFYDSSILNFVWEGLRNVGDAGVGGLGPPEKIGPMAEQLLPPLPIHRHQPVRPKHRAGFWFINLQINPSVPANLTCLGSRLPNLSMSDLQAQIARHRVKYTNLLISSKSQPTIERKSKVWDFDNKTTFLLTQKSY